MTDIEKANLIDLANVSGIDLRYHKGKTIENLIESPKNIPSSIMTFLLNRYRDFQIDKCINDGHICHISLQMGLDAVFIPVGQDAYLELGPYLPVFLTVDDVISRLTDYDLPTSNELIRFFVNSCPVCSHEKIESTKKLICSILHISYDNSDVLFSDASGMPVASQLVSLDKIESDKRIVYRYEKIEPFLGLLSNGDFQKCFKLIMTSRQYQIGNHFCEDPFKNEKVKAVYYASIFSIVSVTGGASPIKVDQLFCRFIRKLEDLKSVEEVIEANFDMLHSFCDLIQEEINHYSPTVKQIRHYLLLHSNLPLDIDDLCKTINLPRTKCESLFKKECNLSISKYHQELRLKRAVELLSNPALPINQVAVQTGFMDQNYFTRVFKKAFGYTPKHYRDVVLRTTRANP